MSDLDNVKCVFCKGVGKLNDATCTHCKGKGTLRFEMASTEQVDYLTTFTDMVMEQIYGVTGIEGAWISDESCVGDFVSEDSELTALNEALGVKISFQDTIVEVAKRLRDA